MKKDPLKALRKKSFFHWLFGPIIRWSGDRRARREEVRRAREFRLVGYFRYQTNFTDTKRECVHIIRCDQNDLGERSICILSHEERGVFKNLYKEHPWWGFVMAWKAGDDSVRYLMQSSPLKDAPKLKP